MFEGVGHLNADVQDCETSAHTLGTFPGQIPFHLVFRRVQGTSDEACLARIQSCPYHVLLDPRKDDLGFAAL